MSQFHKFRFAFVHGLLIDFAQNLDILIEIAERHQQRDETVVKVHRLRC